MYFYKSFMYLRKVKLKFLSSPGENFQVCIFNGFADQFSGLFTI